MRTILITALAAAALAGAAQAQIIAPDTSGTIHPAGSFEWPREDSFAYLRAHGISKEDAAQEALNYSTAPVGTPVARVASGTKVSATVPEYGNMPSNWQGTWQEWREHQDACAAKFRSYSRSDDTYYSAAGKRRFCQAGFDQ